MSAVRIPLGGLTDGVSTRPMPLRGPGTLASAVNVMMRRARGLEKRPGTTLVKAPTAGYNLDITNPTQTKFYHWIDRDTDEKFLVVVDPANAGVARVEVFTLVVRGTGAGTAGNEAAGQKMTLSSTSVAGNDPLDYIAASGTTSARHRFRALTVTDTTIITNRDVTTGTSGAAIDYKKSDAATLIRNVGLATSNNLASWNSFPQPPTGTCAAGTTSSDYIYYARDDDLGWPSGWYRASSTTTPPWYTRIRTEPANSIIDYTKWPVQLKFTGGAFVLSFPAWSDRFSGDSFTNPGPQITSGASAPHKIRDTCFFQSRLWFGAYEFVDSSQIGDVFNLWNNSYVTTSDSDPINVSLQSDAVTTIDFLIPFDGGLVALTRGSRQFEIRSQGAMSPSTVSILPSTSYQTVDYCPPTKLGSQLYFAGERSGSMLIYEYQFQADRASNLATDITAEVEGYIPIRGWTIQASTVNDMLFILSTSDVEAIYVNQASWQEGRATQRAWMRWLRECPAVHACHVMASTLYILTQRDGGKLYLETRNIDLPVDDDSSETPTTINGYAGSGDMGFDLCLDAKSTYQGVYSAVANTTTWTVPYQDSEINRVVLGQKFDCDYEFPVGTFNEQRSKGKVLIPTTEGGNLTITVGGGATTIVAPGNYATNGHGDNAKAWVGIGYEMRVRLNEQFVRDQNGIPTPGRVQLKHLMLRLAGTGEARVEITPQGRDLITFPYVNDQVGTFNVGEGLDVPDYEEFNLPCLCRASDSIIEIVSDSVFPCRIVGGEFRAVFVADRYDPTRK